MARDTVKWFNKPKGFEFISQASGGSGVFVRFSAIQSSGCKTLIQDQQLNYEAQNEPKGLQYVSVTAAN